MSNPYPEFPPAAWRDFLAAHAGGGALDGLVVKVVPFGAFIELADGIVGLLHESEWTAAPEVGSRIPVRIKAVDVERQRMSLRPA